MNGKKPGRPRKPENMRGINVWITLPAAIVERLDKQAESRMQSRNECLREIIIGYFLDKK